MLKKTSGLTAWGRLFLGCLLICFLGRIIGPYVEQSVSTYKQIAKVIEEKDIMEKTKELILVYEKQYAAKLSSMVIDKPKLSSLMIFIPFLFIFYIRALLKFKKGIKGFAVNYLSSREKALREASDVFTEPKKMNTLAMAKQSGLNKIATEKYADYLEILATHYLALFKAKGDDYDDLVRSAYNKKNYRAFTEKLVKAEQVLNKALTPKQNKNQDGISETIKKIEKGNLLIRRDEIKKLFG